MQLTSWYRIIQASLPTSRNFMLGVDVGTMPYALRTAFDLLGLTSVKDKLSIDQVVAALQNHEQTLEDQLGRTADDLIRDLNQFLADQEHVRISRRASAKRSWWVHPSGRILDAGDDHTRSMEEEKDLFQGKTDTRDAVAAGWIRVGYYGWEFNLNIPPDSKTTSQQLDAVQRIYMGLPLKPPIYVIGDDYSVWFDGEGFLRLRSPKQLKSLGLRERPDSKSSWSY